MVTARVETDRTLPDTPRVQILRARVRFDPKVGEYVVSVSGGQGSHLLSSFAEANCLVRIPAHQTRIAEGERVDVMLI